MKTVTCPECWGKMYEEVMDLHPAHAADTVRVMCSACEATGEVEVEDCPDCEGHGSVEAICSRCAGNGTRYPERNGPTCRKCGGSGTAGEQPCLSCDGWGKKARVQDKLVPLPAEMGEELEDTQTREEVAV